MKKRKQKKGQKIEMVKKKEKERKVDFSLLKKKE